jgi:tRNA A-37 threonylcarbamoyl transferase component Bud32
VIGETVGGYRLLEKLGEGGMGEVYLAQHRYIARRAAIKFLLPELAGSGEVASRFFSEARAASLIQHPGIVEVLDCDVHRDGRAFIVVELLEGESLRGYLERTGKRDGDPAGAMAIGWQMASALAAAHGKEIIHRDLKPENVFLHVRTGQPPHQPIVKLLDFGIAKLQIGGAGATRTRTGQLLGTPLYMSPEQCRGARQIDARSDIYSLGCILFEIFCGRPPFLAEGFGDLIIAHVSQPPPDPREFAPGMTPGLRDIVARCLEKEPSARPARVADVAAMLAAEGAAEVVRLREPVTVAPLPGVERAVAPTLKTPPVEPPAEPATAPAGGTRVLSSGSATTLGTGASEVLISAGARKPWKKIALAAFIAAGGATILILASTRRSVTTPSGSGVTVPAAVRAPEPRLQPPAGIGLPPPGGATAAPAGSQGPSPARVTITLAGIPAHAVVHLDGRVTSSPLLLPKGSEDHRLTVQAEGFEPWTGVVDGTSDRTLRVPLIPKRTAVAPRAAKQKKTKDKSNDRGDFTGFSDI